MFVTNWLTWNTEIMLANCSTPNSRMSGWDFNFVFFYHSASVVTALWAVSQQTNKAWKMASQVQSALNWRLFRSQQACGAQHQAVPYTVIHLSCHIQSSAPSLRRLVQRKGFQPLAHCELANMFLPVGLCGLESGNIVTPTLHASRPPSALGHEGWWCARRVRIDGQVS